MLKHFSEESNASLSAFKKTKQKTTQGMMWDISEQNTGGGGGGDKNSGA